MKNILLLFLVLSISLTSCDSKSSKARKNFSHKLVQSLKGKEIKGLTINKDTLFIDGVKFIIPSLNFSNRRSTRAYNTTTRSRNPTAKTDNTAKVSILLDEEIVPLNFEQKKLLAIKLNNRLYVYKKKQRVKKVIEKNKSIAAATRKNKNKSKAEKNRDKKINDLLK